MNWREAAVREDLELKGFTVLLSEKPSNEVPGMPDFRCMNFQTGERFYVEVKSSEDFLNGSQTKTINQLIRGGLEVRLARVEVSHIRYFKLDKKLGTTFLEEVKRPLVKGREITKCPFCGYEYEKRTEKPKKCPACQKWLPMK